MLIQAVIAYFKKKLQFEINKFFKQITLYRRYFGCRELKNEQKSSE